ncbi:hypothetical protein Q0Z83_023290 [Actinoplanes sichuanensis]|uniref:Secreted protein n=1 Tax=Actinoplanes sichuanensis TaxID=512349 RepID=A0ABW4A0K6_9ACTN|nr:hypothetical protein [Actinoplanes sichuanensis]BEL04138.1 hypothetical protein Q0Z83_023290 [Actinoplanes sichuanensis]
MSALPRRLGLRPLAIVATALALLLLAMSQLASPGNVKRAFGPAVDSPVVVLVQAACEHPHTGDQTTSSQHRQDDVSAPAVAPVLRPPADTTGILLPDLRTDPVLAVAVTPADDSTALPAADPAGLGVLRI